jgi:signal transduction histidine kinase
MRPATGSVARPFAEELELASLGLVHDLRNPLSAAAGAFHVLEALLGQGDEDTRFFRETVRRSLSSASEIIDGWRELIAATCTGERMRPVDLRRLVAQVATELNMDSGHAGDLLTVCRLPTVVAQRQKIRLALHNLLENARLYRRDGIPLQVVVGSGRRRGHHFIFVRDNGRGIPSAHQSTIFEAFRRVPGSPGTGLGLGLNLVKRVVEQHGGNIWLDSRVGVGTTFYFTL